MKIRVEIVYALPDRQWVVALDLPAGATVRDALAASGIEQVVSDAGVSPAGVGVWGHTVTLDTPVRDRDRVEIYRELQVDSKTARRLRAERRRRP